MPIIGCHCKVCTSDDHKDKRTRAGIYIQYGEKGILVDTPTDLRAQALACGLEHADAVLFTHSHADHVHGIDDLRAFNFIKGSKIPVYGDADTMRDIRTRFDYIFNPPLQQAGGIPGIEPNVIDGPFDLYGLHVVPVPIMHGRLRILGYRIGPLAYLTDCSKIPDKSRELLLDLDLLILGALRPFPHPTHFSFDEAVQEIGRIEPKRALLTHISHHVTHKDLDDSLPENVSPSYDGQVIELDI